MQTTDKKSLRRQIKDLYKAHSTADLAVQSRVVAEGIEQLDEFREAHTVALFWSLSDEIYTHDLVRRAAHEKRVVLPVVDGDDMTFREVDSCENLQTGAFGIAEPRYGKVCQPDEIDFILVPGVAFDASGRRLGRGRGYYDKYLPRTKAYRVGVCFDYQFVAEVPAEAHDQRVQRVLYVKP